MSNSSYYSFHKHPDDSSPCRNTDNVDDADNDDDDSNRSFDQTSIVDRW